MKNTTRTIRVFIALLLFTGNLPVQAQVVTLSHYLFPGFVKGTVKFKNATQQEAQLNYNSLTQEMLFLDKDTPLALDQTENIDTIYIQGRKFIPTEKAFFEVATTGATPLLIRHKCTVIPPGKPAGYGSTSQASGITTLSGISSNLFYKLQLPADYKLIPETEFLLKKGKDYVKITGVKQFITAFPAKSDAIKAYVKQNDPNFKDPADLVKLVDFCNRAS
ncbi:hypothetical protein [Hufsiella ginkgonis]|uniref:DUF4369 domain-containing protein n=1 Tax=Hufsiella ginkgonis TaxID=2695274 RepID=A0A7K1Y197_9SPHI|nr:hypothetical protein [Hufsiella ginkgonis]MXV17020.1 hypothetical protein [Hufsiella ginkgonis]